MGGNSSLCNEQTSAKIFMPASWWGSRLSRVELI